MRTLLQRVTRASVRVDGEIVGDIGPGLVILLGVGPADTDAVADDLARRVGELRIIRDEDGRTNRSLADVGGAARGSPMPRHPTSPSGATSGSPPRSAPPVSRSR